MNARSRSRLIKAFTKPVYTREQMAEDFLYFHLNVARNARERIARVHPGSDDVLIERGVREKALRAAGQIVDSLRRMKYPLSRHVKELMDSEALT